MQFDCMMTENNYPLQTAHERRFIMSTIESAIAFSLVLIMLAFMITAPEALALESFERAKDGGNELFYMERDKEVAYKNTVRGVVCYDTSPEKLCTYLSGVSDNFRIIYGAVYDLSKEAQDAEG